MPNALFIQPPALIPRDAASGRFVRISENMLNFTRDVVIQQITQLANQVRSNIGANFRNPGRMQSAVGVNIQQRGNQWVGTVDVSGEYSGVRLPFMRIQEYGGVVSTPEIFPKNRQALRFVVGGETVFAKRTRPHPTRIPARSYLQVALQQRQAAITEAFRQAVQRATSES